MTTVPAMPTWAELRRRAGHADVYEFAGLPMPVEEASLVVAKGHPWYDRLHGARIRNGEEVRVHQEQSDLDIVNFWHCPRTRRDVLIYRHEGKLQHAVLPAGPMERATAIFKCVGISMTMDIAAEEKAMTLLSKLIKPHMFNAYRMTGAFFETSRRSGVVYVFRRLATTLAWRPGPSAIHFLAALCLHPIAYYDGLPMGTMVPTDDLIAHLVMMRADEHLFWRKANQHVAWNPGALL